MSAVHVAPIPPRVHVYCRDTAISLLSRSLSARQHIVCVAPMREKNVILHSQENFLPTGKGEGLVMVL